MIMKGTNIKPHLISEITKTCSANCDLSTKFNNSQRQNEDSLPAAFFYTGVGLVWSISCAAIHDRFTKVVFVVNLCRIFPCRKRNCRWTYYAVVSVVNENCAHVFAAQEKELPHRKKNWAGLFSQWWTFPNWSSDTVTRLNLSLGMNCNRLFLNLMLLGKRLIMTGALEVFQCHHHGRMTGDDRETRKRHIFPISASALNCIIVQFDRRYQMNQWPELKLKMRIWM